MPQGRRTRKPRGLVEAIQCRAMATKKTPNPTEHAGTANPQHIAPRHGNMLVTNVFAWSSQQSPHGFVTPVLHAHLLGVRYS